jgi:hypothetical protein
MKLNRHREDEVAERHALGNFGTFALLSEGGEEQPDHERVRNVDKERPD